MRKKPVDYDEALARMEAKCAVAEHCSSEMRTSLMRLGIAPADIASILHTLRSRGFVNDSRYAVAFVRDKYRFSAWGRHKIASALRAKGISADIIASALGSVDSREYVRIAFKALASRLRSIPPDTEPRATRDKLLRFGIARGYEMALLIKILESDRLWLSRK